MTLLLTLLLSTANLPRLTPAEVHALVQKGEAVVVDVRGTVPYELGHIAGAVWMPLGLMNQRAGELPLDKLIVTYCTCKAEETSIEAAQLLAKHGFAHVAVMQGGYPAWKEAGLPTESNREQPVATPVAGRIAPPAAVSCNRNDLSLYAGKVASYSRSRGKTVIVIDTTSDTREKVTLRHPGSDDPSRFFLIHGTPFTERDWNRIEARRGKLRPDVTVFAWICDNGATVIDWRPGVPASAAE